LLSYPGRELLVKSVLSSMPMHFLTVYELPKWAIRERDRFKRIEGKIRTEFEEALVGKLGNLHET
jgi:hypothetical protein